MTERIGSDGPSRGIQQRVMEELRSNKDIIEDNVPRNRFATRGGYLNPGLVIVAGRALKEASSGKDKD